MAYSKPETQNREVPERPERADETCSPYSLFANQTLCHQRLVGNHWVLGRQRRGRFSGRRGRAKVEVV
ncbi:hypothetical protein ACFL6T_05865 [Candidatus Zixiibacteriota bacterium]